MVSIETEFSQFLSWVLGSIIVQSYFSPSESPIQ